MHPRKAAPDLVPAETWKFVSHLVAEPLAHLFTDFCRRRCVPLAYAGSKVVAVYKRKGCPHSAASFRPISLMKVEAKLFSRLILEQLAKTLSHHAGQFGSGLNAGTGLPQLVVRQLAAIAHDRNLAHATLFVDIKAAFDRVLRPLLWGCGASDQDGTGLLQEGYNAPQCDLIARFLVEHPSILSLCGVPASILSVLRSWGQSTWFTTSSTHTDGVDASRTLLGVRQGDNVSAIMFDLFYGHILERLHRCLREAGLLIELACPVGRSYSLEPRAEQSLRAVHIGPIAYRDDLSLGVWGDSNTVLINKIVRVAEIVERVHSEFHLEVNFSASKTETTVALCAPDSKAVWQGMRLVGRARKLRQPAIAVSDTVTLAVAGSYAHLGCLHCQDLSLRGEAHQMLNRARAALSEKKRALTNQRISIASRARLAIYNVYVRCHFLQNIAVIQLFPKALMQKLEAEYLRGIRICTDQVVKFAGDVKLSTEAMLGKFGVPPLSALMERRSLSFFLKLATVDNIFVRSTVAGSFSSRSSWQRTFAALNSLKECQSIELRDLPPADENSVYAWATFAVNHRERWCAMAKNHKQRKPWNTDAGWHGVLRPGSERVSASQEDNAEDQIDLDAALLREDALVPSSLQSTPIAEITHSAIDEAEDPAAQAPEEDPLQCPHCNFRGKNNSGLQAHLRRSHKIFDPLI
eukprot:3590313-Amphidinium_carterae.1